MEEEKRVPNYNPKEDDKEYIGTKLLDGIERGASSWYKDERTLEGWEYLNPLSVATAGAIRGVEGVGWVLGNTPVAGDLLKGIGWAEDRLAEGARNVSGTLTPDLDPRFAGWGTRLGTAILADKGIRKAAGATKATLREGAERASVRSGKKYTSTRPETMSNVWNDDLAGPRKTYERTNKKRYYRETPLSNLWDDTPEMTKPQSTAYGDDLSVVPTDDLKGLEKVSQATGEPIDVIALKEGLLNRIDDEPLSINESLKQWQAKAIPSDIHVDDLSPDSMLPILNELPEKLGYDISDVRTSTIKTKLVPPEIGTPYLQHARAFQRANVGTGRTLEDFPHLWYKGEPYVLKTRGETSSVALEPWKARVTRRKIGKLNRRRRLEEQSIGVKKGTAAYEKVRQLRELNAKELEAGLPRTRLRDAELDHINALRSVDYYTDGMPPDLTKQFYQKLGAEGLFTGDHASNLRVRQRAVHRRLWPLMKKRLAELGHRHTGFKTQQERFNYYNSVNPKTGVTRIEEYAEVVYKIEELGDDMMTELLSIAKKKKPKGKLKVAPSDPVKEALIEIFGGGEDGIESYKAFMERLKDIPEKIDGKPSNLREQFILEEIVYVRHHL